MRNKILALSALLIIIIASGTVAINTYQMGYKTPSEADDLTEQEIQGLLFMREEEKLARDVYITLYEKWIDLIIFNNIAESEQRHMDSIKKLLDKYEINDPAEGNDIGEFTNQELQNLYQELITDGGKSLIDALTVGGKIEELDIIDLKNYIEQTDKFDIKRVYTNLLEGSKNHLRAFVRELEKQGINYEPFYLSQEEFEDIINDDNGKIQRKENNQNQVRKSQYGQPKNRMRIRIINEGIKKECNCERKIL